MNSTEIDVLDHGYVRLVSYMQPVPLRQGAQLPSGKIVDIQPEGWTGDLEIVRNARTSYNADWRGDGRTEEDPSGYKGSADKRLINYLYEHAHTSPFEAMVFTFEVQAPIFVLRQWHRHRTWSYNEVSARYTELPDLFYIPDIEQIRPQSKTNKQGRAMDGEIIGAGNVQREIAAECESAYKSYRMMLDAGVSREIARMVLPVNIYSRMFATVNLHNLFRFLTLRLDSHAQFEIRVYAEALLRLIEPIVPVAAEAFKKGIYEADPMNPPPGLDRDE